MRRSKKRDNAGAKRNNPAATPPARKALPPAPVPRGTFPAPVTSDTLSFEARAALAWVAGADLESPATSATDHRANRGQ